jgi:predicted SAM-dependent methyltransferase
MVKKKNTLPVKLHLGCGDKHYKGFINCDIRKTKATDKVFDCSELKPFRSGCADLIFSHAFVEHLEVLKQEAFFKECFRVLTPTGKLIILGIPDFEAICKAYLEEKQVFKNKDEIFTLYSAYRLTHGDPEDKKGLQVWQMHKSLFDKYALNGIAESVGFTARIIFNYAYKNELIKTNLCLVASKEYELRLNDIKLSLKPFSEYFEDLEKDIPKL